MLELRASYPEHGLLGCFVRRRHSVCQRRYLKRVLLEQRSKVWPSSLWGAELGCQIESNMKTDLGADAELITNVIIDVAYVLNAQLAPPAHSVRWSNASNNNYCETNWSLICFKAQLRRIHTANIHTPTKPYHTSVARKPCDRAKACTYRRTQVESESNSRAVFRQLRRWARLYLSNLYFLGYSEYELVEARYVLGHI